MGLYERLLQEAARLPVKPDREDRTEGGYVTAEELREEAREEQERRRREVGNLASLTIHEPQGIAPGYARGVLKRRYPLEYAGFLAAKRTRSGDGTPSENRPVRGTG